MLLEDRIAVVYGAGGAVGGAVARAFAEEGALVVLTGRTAGPLEAVGAEIRGAETAVVDALDEAAVEAHLDDVVDRLGRVDVSFNAVGVSQAGVQGTPLVELSAERFADPVAAHLRTNFLTSRAAARRMAARGSGAIVALTAIPARAALPLVGGMAPAWAGVEALIRSLAAELGPRGVRAVCIRSHAIPETPLIAEVTAMIAPTAGASREELLAGMATGTLLGRLPTLAEVATLVTVAASDRVGAMTGAVLNVSAGRVVD